MIVLFHICVEFFQMFVRFLCRLIVPFSRGSIDTVELPSQKKILLIDCLIE